MSASIAQRVKLFSQRRPFIFNSIIYGTFYTGAEFAQQSYTRFFKLSSPVPPAPKENVPITIDPGSSPVAWLQSLSKSLGLMDDGSTQSGSYNWPQLKRYAIYGCFLAGSVLHVWYKWLDWFFQGTSMRIILVKLFADQFILSPPLVTMFFVSMSTMEGKSDIFAECKTKFVPTFATSCIYWIPVQFMNFLFVPAALRVSFVSVAAFCWVNILCYFKSAPAIEYEKKKCIDTPEGKCMDKT